MTAIAYIANEFPSPLEPYVMDEITELRRHGIEIICCSGKRVAPDGLSLSERAFWKETRFCQPLSDQELLKAARQLAADRGAAWSVAKPLVFDRHASVGRRIRGLGHTLMGAALAEELAPLEVTHIHAHHGYFASWMALVAARLLGIGFSFTLHGSDLLRRADLLDAKLEACRFCVTVSEFNRRHILRNYPATPPEKIIVQRLGVDRILPWPQDSLAVSSERRALSLLAVGRLHRVKDYEFLIRACAELRMQGLAFVCRIAGDGPERLALQNQIMKLGLEDNVRLLGHMSREDLVDYYRRADLVVMTSKSEGIPVALMEAMSYAKLVLAPAITGIPELVDDGRTGFLYRPGDLADFVGKVIWMSDCRESLAGVGRTAAAKVSTSYNRQRNLRAFAEQFLIRANCGGENAGPLLQQVRLSV